MKHYELTCLISPNFSEEELKTLSEKLTSLVQENGGILKDTKGPAKQKLAYPIKDHGFSFVITLGFQSNPEKISDLEKKLKSESGILRYMMVNKKILKEKIRTRWKPSDLKIKELSKKLLVKKEKKPEEKKVELKEIEKKLEEIIGQ